MGLASSTDRQTLTEKKFFALKLFFSNLFGSLSGGETVERSSGADGRVRSALTLSNFLEPFANLFGLFSSLTPSPFLSRFYGFQNSRTFLNRLLFGSHVGFTGNFWFGKFLELF